MQWIGKACCGLMTLALATACGKESSGDKSKVAGADSTPTPAPVQVPAVAPAPPPVATIKASPVVKAAVAEPAPAAAVKKVALSNQLDEVGLLFRHDSTAFVIEACTGTLIQTANHLVHNVVLTAKHCTDLDTFYIGSGKALDITDHLWQSAAVGMTAYKVVDSYELDSGDVDDAVCPHPATDMRLLVLDRDVPTIVPAMLASKPPDLTAQCKFVGFGEHLDPATGAVVQFNKRSFPVPLGSLTSMGLLQSNVDRGVPGRGDSGGPLFCGDQLVGTDSCGASVIGGQFNINQAYARADQAAAKIDAQIAKWLAVPVLAQVSN